MKELTNYIGNSRWTSASRHHAVHVAEPYQNPLCGKTYRGGCSDSRPFNLDEVTCVKCKKLAQTRLSLHSIKQEGR